MRPRGGSFLSLFHDRITINAVFVIIVITTTRTVQDVEEDDEEEHEEENPARGIQQINDASPFFAAWRQPRDTFYATLARDPELAAHLNHGDAAAAAAAAAQDIDADDGHKSSSGKEAERVRELARGFIEILDYIRDNPAERIREYHEDARVVQAMAGARPFVQSFARLIL